METAKLTVRLPKRDLDFAKRYAEAHRITVTELIGRYLRLLQSGTGTIHREVESISGMIPAEVNARAERLEDTLRKHR